MGTKRPPFLEHRGQQIKLNRQPLGLGQRHFFEGSDALLDRVGLALCDLNYFPKKELFESQAFARKTQRLLNRLPKDRPWTALDVGAGHGLTSLFLASYVKPHRLAASWVVDPFVPQRCHELFATFFSIVPAIQDRVERKSFCFADWVAQMKAEPKLWDRNYIWLGCHACGELSDAILEMAFLRNEPFCVMPCCPNRRLRGTWPKGMRLRAKPDLDVHSNIDVGVAHDLMRMGLAQSFGYRVLLREIDAKITPHNRILLGTPPAP